MATSRRSQMTSQRPWRYQGQLYYGISSADAVGVCAVPVPAPVPYQIRLGRGVWTVSSVGGAGYYVFVGGGLTTRVWLAACSASVAALATTRSVRITQVQSTGRVVRANVAARAVDAHELICALANAAAHAAAFGCCSVQQELREQQELWARCVLASVGPG